MSGTCSSHPTHDRAAGANRLRERAATVPITVNGVTISRKAIAAELQNFAGRSPIESWHAAARALVIREVLLQEARGLQIPVAQQIDEDGRKETEEDALLRALIEQKVPVPDADEDTLRRFYQNNLTRFLSPSLYEVRHILIAARRDDVEAFAAAREKAQSIADMLERSPDRFEELAKELSDCPSAKIGGNLGQISPGDTTQENSRGRSRCCRQAKFRRPSRHAMAYTSSAWSAASRDSNCRLKQRESGS